MKKILPFLTVLVFLCACIGGGGGDSAESQGQESDSPAVTMPSTGDVVDKMMDMASAIASGQAYKCTYNYEGMITETWIKGEKFRSESEVEGEKMITVSDGVWAYMWNSGEKEGMKFNLKELGEDQGQNQQSDYSYTDLKTISTFADNVECNAQAVADSTFQPSSSIQYTDFGEMLKHMQEVADQMQQQYDQGGETDMCGMCSMIPDEQAKQECLANC